MIGTFRLETAASATEAEVAGSVQAPRDVAGGESLLPGHDEAIYTERCTNTDVARVHEFLARDDKGMGSVRTHALL